MDEIYNSAKDITADKIKQLNKKSSHTFYLKDVNYKKIEDMAEKCNMSSSKILDEIISQLPNVK